MKKLIPALTLLLISAILVGSSTFAWFSMNTTVTATGMTITAKAENVFLQIINSDGTFSDSAAQISADAKVAAKAVYPTKVGKAVTASAVEALAGTETVAALKWAAAYSRDPANSQRETDYEDVSTLANATDASNVYTLKNQFKVRLNPTSGVNTASNLTVSGVKIEATDVENASMLPAVKLLVVSTDGVVVFGYDAVEQAFVPEAGNKLDAIIATTVTVTPVDVYAYIYFDGDDETVKTNNLASTDGFEVEFTMTVSAGSSNP